MISVYLFHNLLKGWWQRHTCTQRCKQVACSRKIVVEVPPQKPSLGPREQPQGPSGLRDEGGTQTQTQLQGRLQLHEAAEDQALGRGNPAGQQSKQVPAQQWPEGLEAAGYHTTQLPPGSYSHDKTTPPGQTCDYGTAK